MIASRPFRLLLAPLALLVLAACSSPVVSIDGGPPICPQGGECSSTSSVTIEAGAGGSGTGGAGGAGGAASADGGP